MPTSILTKDLNMILERVIDCVQQKNIAACVKELHVSLRQKYTVKELAETPLFADPKTLQAILKIKGEEWIIEGNNALLMRDDLDLVLLMKKENGEWKFSGFARKLRKLPKRSDGYRVDEASLESYSLQIREQLQCVLAFHKEVFGAIRSRDLKILQEIFIAFRTRSPHNFERSPLVKYYLTNAGREASRPIDCIRICGAEATIDYVESPLVWYLITLKSRWYIRRVIDIRKYGTTGTVIVNIVMT